MSMIKGLSVFKASCQIFLSDSLVPLRVSKVYAYFLWKSKTIYRLFLVNDVSPSPTEKSKGQYQVHDIWPLI